MIKENWRESLLNREAKTKYINLKRIKKRRLTFDEENINSDRNILNTLKRSGKRRKCVLLM